MGDDDLLHLASIDGQIADCSKALARRRPADIMTILSFPVRATADQAYELTRLRAALEQDDDIEVDASRCTFVGPFAVALIAAALAERRRAGRRNAVLGPPHDEGARCFVEDTGFDRLFTGEAYPLNDTLRLRQLSAFDPTFSEQLSALLATHVPGTPPKVVDLIEVCLHELLQNVFEWASSEVGCFVQARWYARERNLRLAIVDRGKGIPSRLRELPGYTKRSDAELITTAVLDEGVTTRVGRAGGLGLKTIRSLVVDREGALTIVSGNAKAVFRKDPKTPRTSTVTNWPGTAIEIDFRPQLEIPSGVEEVF